MEIVTSVYCIMFQFTRGGVNTAEQHWTSYFTQEETRWEIVIYAAPERLSVGFSCLKSGL